MSTSSILGGIAVPTQADGRDVDLLGPSDSSDSGSDVQGERAMSTAPDNPDEWGAVVAGRSSDTDTAGTGERASADGIAPRDGADILPDHIIGGIHADETASNRRTSVEADDLMVDAPDDGEGTEVDLESANR